MSHNLITFTFINIMSTHQYHTCCMESETEFVIGKTTGQIMFILYYNENKTFTIITRHMNNTIAIGRYT